MRLPGIRIRNSGAALLLLAALTAPRPAAAAQPPQAETLLDWSLQSPDVPYRGRMMFTQWFGKNTRAEDIQVYHSGQRSRREFLAPDGTVSRVIIDDGDKQELHLVKKGRVLAGDAVKSYEKLMPPEHERELLLKNYRLTVSGPEKVAGRPCWVLEIDPLVAGKPSQKLWLDEETHVVLENKRFIPNKRLAAMIRYSRFTPTKDISDALFALYVATAAAGRGLEPDFMTLEELNKATGKTTSIPAELPGGFEFESADYFQIGKHVVRQARYTDGLCALSLFLTDRPVALPKGQPLSQGAGLARASLRLSSAGTVLRWQRGRQHFTLLGDVTRELLQQAAAAVK